MWSPEAEGRNLTKNTSLRIRCQPTPPKSVSGRWRNSVFGGLAAIFAELEFAGLRRHVFCRQKPKLRLTQIWAPYISPSQRNRTRKRRYRSAKHRFSPAKVSTPISTKSFWDSMWSLNRISSVLEYDNPLSTLPRKMDFAVMSRKVTFRNWQISESHCKCQTE